MVQDISAFHNIDAEVELTRLLNEELSRNINDNILRNLLNNEKSNEICWELPLGFYPIGSCYTINNEILIFSVSGITSAIGIDKDCTYTEILNSECLGFSIEHQIDCTYRIKNGCERIFFGEGEGRQIKFPVSHHY
jgi:hypothetical protein